jgi:hypothetical protein
MFDDALLTWLEVFFLPVGCPNIITSSKLTANIFTKLSQSESLLVNLVDIKN